MRCWLENIVIGEEGKKWIREKYNPKTNYPLACEGCAYPLGILHIGGRTRDTIVYLSGNVRQIHKRKIICPMCRTPYETDKILKAKSSERKKFYSEKEIRLEKLVKKVRRKIISSNRIYD
ncbi:MAG: hypothetical protein QXS38_01660 [Candidatus Pacearchaeota archaeon]